MRKRLALCLFLSAASLATSRDAAADPVRKGRALWENQCQSCHVVTREKTDDKAADGRKVLFNEIKRRGDSELERYLMIQKAHVVCVYPALDIYDARFLIAFMRQFSKPEQRELAPIAKDNSSGPPRGTVTKKDDGK